MARLSRRHIVQIAALVVLTGATAVALRPRPVAVECGRVNRGPLVVTVDEEGRTRVRKMFAVAAPVTGRLQRITIEEGDDVARGAVVARLKPTPLDARAQSQAFARIEAAREAERGAIASVEEVRASLEQARRAHARAEQLAAQGLHTREAHEEAETAEAALSRKLEAATHAAAASAFAVREAEAALTAAVPDSPGKEGPAGIVAVRAPVAGRVIRVVEKSERVVLAGTPLLEVGDISKVEVVAELLTADAVRVKPGARVLIEDWGGAEPLQGRVRLVEPGAFTKVSALGVEEQRVNVVADLDRGAERLGHGYRVEARVVVHEASDVIKVPVSALFREGNGWAVFVVEDGRAQRVAVDIGPRNEEEAEVTSGLAAGALVILHPSDQVAAGVRVRPGASS